MKLVTRLVASHAGLAAILLMALALVLIAIGRIDSLMLELRERELDALVDEETLYRAAWGIELAARRSILDCETGAPSARVADTLSRRLDELRALQRRTSSRVARPVRAAAEEYVRYGEAVLAGDVCEKLRSPELRRSRLLLDERLTNAWVDRIYAFHHAIYAKEERARRMGVLTLALGASVGVFALATAALVARRIARGVTVPLEALARAARRVGRGDFSPIQPAGGPAEVVDLSHELDRMRAHLAELDQLKQSFIASVSHELRTPLAKVREALALLGDGAAGALGERQARVVSIARAACESQIRLVNTLLDLSRLRAGHPLKLEPGSSIDAALREAIAQESTEAEARGVTLEIDAPGAAPPALLDVALIERAVANLVRNAVSVSPRGERVRITREVRERGPDGRAGRWARVEVSDRGPGVPEAFRDTLFDAFVTHAPEGHPGRVGVGLGLTFARAVARAHRGDVMLEEGAGPGARFTLWVPLECSPESMPSIASRPEKRGPPATNERATESVNERNRA